MVTLSKQKRTKSPRSAVTVAAILMVGGILFYMSGDNSYSTDYWVSQALLSQTNLAESSVAREELKAFRQQVRKQCNAATTQDQVNAISDINKSIFKLPVASAKKRPSPRLKPCKNVVLDFGANIGDTAGKFIDAGLVGCRPAKGGLKGIPDPLFDTQAKQFVDASSEKKKNRLAENFGKLMAEINPSTVGPEDYCYYGVEGNPVFTERLQELETFVMDISPRPLSIFIS